MWANESDVIRRMEEEIGADMSTGIEKLGGIVRRPETDGRRSDRPCWYIANVASSGDGLIVSGGNWRTSAKVLILPNRTEKRSEAEKLADRELDRRNKAEAKRIRAAEEKRAARTAEKMWARLAPEGHSPYLARKALAPHGGKFSPRGAFVIPVNDIHGSIRGLQVIRADGSKRFWPAGMAKKGHFYRIGGIPGAVLLLCEGFATGASLHMATGLPVAIAFDCGNLVHVAMAHAKRYPRAFILVCADDDRNNPANPGIKEASAAAMAVNGAWVAPRFPDSDGAGQA